MGEIKFITGLVMIALFSVAIISYAFGFASDNNAPINLENESKFTTINQETKDDVTKFSVADANSSSITFFKSSLESGDEAMSSGAAFKLGISLISTVKTILSATKTYIFGGSNTFGIFLSAISGLLLFIGIRYIYKTWVGKNPD